MVAAVLRTGATAPVVRAIAAAATVCALATPAEPVTVVPPTFDDLVARAETIFVGRVVDLRAVPISTRRGRTIVTDVTFTVEQTLKGSPLAQRLLEFLGGTVGEDTLRVIGMPVFHVGDRDVLFVAEAGRPVSPIVGFMYGRFRIVTDPRSGVDIIRTHDGRPLGSLDEIGNRFPPARLAPERPIMLTQFTAAIQTRILTPGQRR